MSNFVARLDNNKNAVLRDSNFILFKTVVIPGIFLVYFLSLQTPYVTEIRTHDHSYFSLISYPPDQDSHH